LIRYCTLCKNRGHEHVHIAEFRLKLGAPNTHEVCWCCWFNYAFEVVPMFDQGQRPNVVRGPAYDRRVRTCELVSQIVQYEDYVRSEDYVIAVYRKRLATLEEIALAGKIRSMPSNAWRAFWGTPMLLPSALARSVGRASHAAS
jgi:hypothetical protein